MVRWVLFLRSSLWELTLDLPLWWSRGTSCMCVYQREVTCDVPGPVDGRTTTRWTGTEEDVEEVQVHTRVEALFPGSRPL